MKRLLLTGALVASVLFCAPAHADDAMNTRVLKVEIIGTSKAHPEAFAAVTVRLNYETRFTCEEAQEELQQLDTQAITKLAQRKLARKHITVRGVAASCEVAAPHI